MNYKRLLLDLHLCKSHESRNESAINSEIISTLCNSSGSNFNQRRTYPKIDEAEEFLLQRDDVLSSLQQKQKNTQVAKQKNLLKLLANLIPFFSVFIKECFLKVHTFLKQCSVLHDLHLTHFLGTFSRFSRLP